MLQLIEDKTVLMELLLQGSYVITPNNRLSLSLINDYYHNMQQATVAKPHCLPFAAFIRQIHQRLLLNDRLPAASPILLSGPQCRYLWEQVLKSQADFTYSKGLLNTVMEAWRTCLQWQISPEDENFKQTPQCEEFQQWWHAFNRKLKQLNVLPEEQLTDYLISTGFSLISQPLIWACFDNFTPQQQLLQKHSIQQGIQNYIYDLSSDIEFCSEQFIAKDEEEECTQLIQWLLDRLDSGEKKIAVVVPDLQQRSRTLQRQFKRHIKDDVFNFSLGQSLNHYPLVTHAFICLSLNSRYLTHHQAQVLLYSAYLKGSDGEFHQRTQAAQDSSLLREKNIALSQWIKTFHYQLPVLTSCLEQLNNYPIKASIDEWIELFVKRLEILGFPGDLPLNSENHQCFQRFFELFDSFKQLALISTTLSFQEAFQALCDLAQQTIFQPESKNKPVQVLGLLEASGCEFDSLWCMGLTDQCLPAKTQLSPFIPYPLQREKNMPHSSPEHEWQLALRLLQRFQRASKRTVFSYPELSGDTPNLPSPLITEMAKFIPSVVLTEQSSLPPLNILKENYVIPLQPDELISGGTTLLANQAKCPFRAFAAHRLRAKPANRLKDGLDPQERGQIVHKVMEKIWRSLGNQQKLLSLDEQALHQCIETAIKDSLRIFFMDKNELFPSLMKEVELTRLKRLIYSCLSWEKQRPSFTIEAIEKDFIFRIHDQDFKVRVDRIDKLEDEEKWVIDYKTTIPAGQPWNEDRPIEPQLLLYALLDEAIKTLMFIQLKAGQITSKSFSEKDLNIPHNRSLKNDESWSKQRKRWKKLLDDLVKEFSDGYCAPQPIHSSICTQCDFQSLCRLTSK
ncbi:PD-(D/E)XK nuclease family protein [Legionella israelensis]|uniref:PD-(D/E)XK nuclease family protein n=1 Tax=Legionella israelensis TaxID=454 RepID=UPI00117DC453|nr:PD-(D/E)XK nuclease family protein [Legionella israelensis]QDP72275.1 PD-(D/E)XK nuclease family protein [Legionella israelensis]